MKNVNNFQIAKVHLRVLLSFCLIFCQFQPSVAYKSFAYKACIENMKLKFTLKHHCPLNRRADVYRVWFTVTPVHGNKQVAATTSD